MVIVDLDKHALVELVEGRTHKAINQALESWGDKVLSQIEEVSIDLSGNYRGLVRKRLPNAEIVADRFHVSKLISNTLNQARISAKQALTEIESESERKRLASILKGSKYALLKPEENLTDNQKEKLESIKEAFPLLSKMHQQKEDFRAIFEESEDWTSGTFALMDWMKDAAANFSNNMGTLTSWFAEITAYFEKRTTSGVVEGINNRLKLIKRLGYGFRNFESFRLRCLICWHLDVS